MTEIKAFTANIPQDFVKRNFLRKFLLFLYGMSIFSQKAFLTGERLGNRKTLEKKRISEFVKNVLKYVVNGENNAKHMGEC